jgi:hypothetical protein
MRAQAGAALFGFLLVVLVMRFWQPTVSPETLAPVQGEPRRRLVAPQLQNPKRFKLDESALRRAMREPNDAGAP